MIRAGAVLAALAATVIVSIAGWRRAWAPYQQAERAMDLAMAKRGITAPSPSP